MEMFSDDFISYDTELNVKLEKSSDHEISLSSPSNKTCESTPNLLPLNFSPRLQSLLARVSYGGLVQAKNKPFTIIKTKNIDVPEHVEVKIENEEKILSKSKLIMKREKAKQRAMTKQANPIAIKIEADVASEVPESCTGEVKNKKKILQMIRNRISAQTSRDRKKAYLYQLEDAKTKLSTENSLLKQQNTSLLQEISKLKEANKKISQNNEQMRDGSEFDMVETTQNNKNRSDSDKSFVESIVRNVLNNMNGSGAYIQNKSSLNEISAFATTVSSLVFNQLDNYNMKTNENKLNNNQSQEDSEGLLGASNKIDIKSVFDKIQNDDSVYNYTSDYDKQNTILQHLAEMPKLNKSTFFKASKENYNNDQTIFSLTNFNLTEKDNDFLMKDLKQEESHYSFGIKTSNLL